MRAGRGVLCGAGGVGMVLWYVNKNSSRKDPINKEFVSGGWMGGWRGGGMEGRLGGWMDGF